MLGLKLNHVSKRGPRRLMMNTLGLIYLTQCQICVRKHKKKTHLYFHSFLDAEKVQAEQIYPDGRKGPVQPKKSITQLIMIWQCRVPGLQQTWYSTTMYLDSEVNTILNSFSWKYSGFSIKRVNKHIEFWIKWQTISWNKICVFQLKLPWSLFPGVQLSQHWFR